MGGWMLLTTAAIAVGLWLVLMGGDRSIGFTVVREVWVRLIGCSLAGWAYITHIWLCCLLARSKGYHVAVGWLAGLSVVGAGILYLLASKEILPACTEVSWAGGRHLLALFGTWALVCLAFWNSFDSGWVLDNLYIIRADPRTRAQAWQSGPNPITNPGVIEYFNQDYWWPKGISGLYRPLTSITYWVNWTVLAKGGDDAHRFKEFSLVRGFHAVNLVVHWLNAVLLYVLALVLTRKWGLAVLGSALFAVHPITTESVTNIIGRADLFAAFGVLSGVLVWRWGSELPRWHKLWGFFAVMLIVAFGVFSKESAIAIGLILLIYDVAYRWNPVVSKWLGAVLLVMLVPAISGASFAIGRSDEQPTSTLTIVLGVTLFVLGVVGHLVMLRASDKSRLLGLGGSVIAAIVASAFVPWMGVALVCALIAIEYVAGPWFKRCFIEFDRIRLAAMGYTAGFVLMLVLPLAFGAAIWFKSGSAAKHSIPDEVLLGPLNVLLGTWAYDVAVDQSFDWVSQYYRAGMIVGLGVLVWALFVARCFAARAAAITAIPLIVLAGAWLLTGRAGVGDDPSLVPDHSIGMIVVANLLILLALLVLLGQRRDARPQPWLAMPVVLILALGACFFVFWAGFVLTFIVGLIELIKQSTMPRILRQSAVWKDLLQRFMIGYYLLLPPVVALFFVRYWIFNIQSTPPETPFLDNPLRGGEFSPVPFWQSRMTAVKVMGKLLYLLFWPKPLTADYSWDQIPFFLDLRAPAWEHIKAVIALLIIVGLIVLACRSLPRNKPLFFFIMFFFAAMLPTSNIPVLMGSIMAERFMYLPLIGFAGAMAAVLTWLACWVLKWIHGVAWSDDRDEQDAPALPYLLARGFIFFAIPMVILGLLTARAYLRNFDWRSDVTLWESAVKICPRAFRCYQSLAYAYFEENAGLARPYVPYVERMISVAEQARPIVDVLPDDRNSSRLYLHLGMYYCIKGELTSLRDRAGNLIVTPASRPWFEKSIDALERGVRVDRSFNDINRRRQIKRGDKPEKILDAGLTPVYMQMGISYLRLGMYREALNAFNYQRQLEPDSTDAYMRIALLHIDQGRYDDAAVALIQTVQLDGQRQDAWHLLAQIYGGSAGGQNALVPDPDGTGLRLNVQNPLVRDHLMLAARSFIRTFRYARRPTSAESARRIAIYRFGLPPSLVNPVMFEPLKTVTPFGTEDLPPSRSAAERSAHGH